jgi:hypothetical protein
MSVYLHNDGIFEGRNSIPSNIVNQSGSKSHIECLKNTINEEK